jgi:hypothetical protein
MGDVVQFVRKTEAEKRGFSNGHKFRENTPEDMAVAFYEACWDEAAEKAQQDPANQGNIAKTCVHTEALAMKFLDAAIDDLNARTDGTDNTAAKDTAAALTKLIEARFPNGSQLQQRTI